MEANEIQLPEWYKILKDKKFKCIYGLGRQRSNHLKDTSEIQLPNDELKHSA